MRLWWSLLLALRVLHPTHLLVALAVSMAGSRRSKRFPATAPDRSVCTVSSPVMKLHHSWQNCWRSSGVIDR